MAFALRNLSEAVRAFSAVTSLEPESITGWNNLAYALHASGCGEQAQIALQCGLKNAPDNTNLQDSRNELINTAVNDTQVNCPAIRCN
jgi:predicted Zn-dependent protease